MGKVVVITGAATGIGHAIARLFVAHGAKVVIADVKDEVGETVVNELAFMVDVVIVQLGQLVDVFLSQQTTLLGSFT